MSDEFDFEKFWNQDISYNPDREGKGKAEWHIRALQPLYDKMKEWKSRVSFSFMPEDKTAFEIYAWSFNDRYMSWRGGDYLPFPSIPKRGDGMVLQKQSQQATLRRLWQGYK